MKSLKHQIISLSMHMLGTKASELPVGSLNYAAKVRVISSIRVSLVCVPYTYG